MTFDVPDVISPDVQTHLKFVQKNFSHNASHFLCYVCRVISIFFIVTSRHFAYFGVKENLSGESYYLPSFVSPSKFQLGRFNMRTFKYSFTLIIPLSFALFQVPVPPAFNSFNLSLN